MKEYDKGIQINSQMHRAKSGRVSSKGASVPIELGFINSQYIDVLTTLKLSEAIVLGFLQRLHHFYKGMLDH